MQGTGFAQTKHDLSDRISNLPRTSSHVALARLLAHWRLEVVQPFAWQACGDGAILSGWRCGVAAVVFLVCYTHRYRALM